LYAHFFAEDGNLLVHDNPPTLIAISTSTASTFGYNRRNPSSLSGRSAAGIWCNRYTLRTLGGKNLASRSSWSLMPAAPSPSRCPSRSHARISFKTLLRCRWLPGLPLASRLLLIALLSFLSLVYFVLTLCIAFIKGWAGAFSAQWAAASWNLHIRRQDWCRHRCASGSARRPVETPALRHRERCPSGGDFRRRQRHFLCTSDG
jgi:hypothetical protein